MKITKTNYNELRTQELDNNFAKVWHVNEIREELLANTGGGGGSVTSVEGLVGDVTFQQSNTTSPNISANVEDNSIILNYNLPYQEVILKVENENNTSIENLTYTVDGTNTPVNYPDSLLLIPSTPFECNTIQVQMTISKQFGTPGYTEIPYVILADASNGTIRIGVKRDEGTSGLLNTNGLKSSVNINIKIFGYIAPQP
jgi:hypothetical protein